MRFWSIRRHPGLCDVLPGNRLSHGNILIWTCIRTVSATKGVPGTGIDVMRSGSTQHEAQHVAQHEWVLASKACLASRCICGMGEPDQLRSGLTAWIGLLISRKPVFASSPDACGSTPAQAFKDSICLSNPVKLGLSDLSIWCDFGVYSACAI